MEVLDFLRDQPHLISGLPFEKRSSLYQKFHTKLQEEMPGLLRLVDERKAMVEQAKKYSQEQKIKTVGMNNAAALFREHHQKINKKTKAHHPPHQLGQKRKSAGADHPHNWKEGEAVSDGAVHEKVGSSSHNREDDVDDVTGSSSSSSNDRGFSFSFGFTFPTEESKH
uniref:Uncharacterized protein n=1 Tax=Heterosigma akashiwo TaxID=2829 RepID=A0A7S3Y3X8_HETAK